MGLLPLYLLFPVSVVEKTGDAFHYLSSQLLFDRKEKGRYPNTQNLEDIGCGQDSLKVISIKTRFIRRNCIPHLELFYGTRKGENYDREG